MTQEQKEQLLWKHVSALYEKEGNKLREYTREALGKTPEHQMMLAAMEELETKVREEYALPSAPISEDWRFTYFVNHGDDDGNGCYTICFAGKDEDGDDDFNGDEIIVGGEDTEDDAKEACRRLNGILQAQLKAESECVEHMKEVCDGYEAQLKPQPISEDWKERIDDILRDTFRLDKNNQLPNPELPQGQINMAVRRILAQLKPSPATELDAEKILIQLIQMKRHRDTYGKTAYYMENKPLTWRQAFEWYDERVDRMVELATEPKNNGGAE